MSDIPADAWREVFVRLPAKSVIRCRAVSKAWRGVIDDRCFVKAYVKKQLTSNTKNIILRNSVGPPCHPLCSFDLDALKFNGRMHQTIAATPLDFTYGDKLAFPVAACDGLMLIAPEKPEQKWQIWNPSIHESLELPQGDFDSLKIVATGLGFDEATDDYKAVVIDSRSGRRPAELEEHLYRTHVYSLKSDSWRTIANFPWHDVWGPKGNSLKSVVSCLQPEIGVFMGGSLNWFLSPYQNYDRIIALDLGTETYRELKVPSLPDRPLVSFQERYLDALDSGRLVLIDFGFQFDIKFENFDVWVMKDYEVEDSWTRLFSVEGNYAVTGDAVYGLRLVSFLNNKLQLFFQDRWGFHLYDVQTSSVKMVRPEGLDAKLSNNCISLGTFLSAQVVPDNIFCLHDNCGVGGKKRRIMKRKNKSNVQMADKEIKIIIGEQTNWKIF